MDPDPDPDPDPNSSHGVRPQSSAGREEDAWERTFPASMLHFLGLVHRTYPEDPAWRAPEFLQTLATVTFPMGPPKVGQFATTPTLGSWSENFLISLC